MALTAEYPDDEPRYARIVFPYAPRKAFQAFHATDRRFICLVAHRRAGKTVAAINRLVKEATSLTRPYGKYGYVAPYLSQAKEIAWAYLKRYAQPFLALPPNESELRVVLRNGAEIRLHGSDNPDRLRGAYFDGVVLDEFAMQRAGVYSSVVRPMLADRHGWACFIGTPNGRNQFYYVWKEAENNDQWFRLMIRADTSGIIDRDELEDMQEDMSPEEYSQEMLCSFDTPVQGAYYAEALTRMDAEGRIASIPIDRNARVYTGWDLGRRDATAIWFIQCVGQKRFLVDYYENTDKGLPHYADVIWEKKKEHGWIYATHFFPHDIAVHMIDSDQSRMATMAGLGIEPSVVKAHAVEEGIHAVRRMLDRSYLDPTRCVRGLECLRNYRREWDDKLHAFRNIPLHDQFSNGADAIRTFAAGFDDPRVVSDDASYRRRNRGGPGRPSSWGA